MSLIAQICNSRGPAKDRPHCIHSRCMQHISLVLKMISVQQKAQCVLWHAKFESYWAVQQEFRRVYQQEPPSKPAILYWVKQFTNTGSLLRKKGSGRPRVSNERVGQIAEKFDRSPKTSVHIASLQLGVSKSAVHRVVRRRLHLYPYIPQLRHALQPTYAPNRFAWATEMLDMIDNDPDF